MKAIWNIVNRQAAHTTIQNWKCVRDLTLTVLDLVFVFFYFDATRSRSEKMRISFCWSTAVLTGLHQVLWLMHLHNLDYSVSRSVRLCSFNLKKHYRAFNSSPISSLCGWKIISEAISVTVSQKALFHIRSETTSLLQLIFLWEKKRCFWLMTLKPYHVAVFQCLSAFPPQLCFPTSYKNWFESCYMTVGTILVYSSIWDHQKSSPRCNGIEKQSHKAGCWKNDQLKHRSEKVIALAYNEKAPIYSIHIRCSEPPTSPAQPLVYLGFKLPTLFLVQFFLW